MRHFDYSLMAEIGWPMNTVQAIGEIREHKGRQLLHLKQKPQALEKLEEVARIQSVDASNRLEGIVTTNNRLQELMQDKTTPRNRSEQEIAGYRQVLNMIHESHEAIPVTPNVLLQLHRDLFSQVSNAPMAGTFKNVPNRIEEVHSDGRRIVRFEPTPPYETPGAIAEMCDSFSTVRNSGAVEPLLLIPAFIVDFLCVHPFADGNGRMSRLLMALLLYQSDYLVGKYISIEKLIQENAEQYYDVLSRCNAGWHEGENNLLPFVDFTLGVLLQAYRIFEERLEVVNGAQSAYDLVRAASIREIGTFSVRDLVERLPAISRTSIEKSVRRLVTEGMLERSGAGRGTIYRCIV